MVKVEEVFKSVIIPAFQEAKKEVSELVGKEKEVFAVNKKSHLPAYLSVTKENGATEFKYILKKLKPNQEDPRADVDIETRLFDTPRGTTKKNYKILNPDSDVTGKLFSELSGKEITEDIIKQYKEHT